MDIKKIEQKDLILRLLARREYYLPIILFLSAFLVRLGAMAVSDNFAGHQPMLKLITALHILKKASFFENIHYQHLPFYLYSLVVSIGLGKEQILAGRFLSLLFGSLSVVSFYYLIKLLFDRKTAFYSSLLIGLYPPHILKSIITLPNTMALFFIIGSLYFMMKRKLVLSALFIGLASGYDYLAWAFIATLTLFILIHESEPPRKKIKNALLFFSIAAFFPVIWILLIKYKTGNYYLFYNNFLSGDTFSKVLFGIMLNVQTLVGNLYKYPFPGMFLLAIYGLFWSLLRKKHGALIFWILSLAVFAGLGVFRQEISVFSPGELCLSLLLIPFVIEGSSSILKLLRVNVGRGMYAVIFFLCLGLLSNFATMRPVLPEKVKAVSCWLKKNLTPDDLIFIDKDKDGYYSTIVMLSRLPPGNFCFFDGNEEQQLDERGQGKKRYHIVTNESELFSLDKDVQIIAEFDTYKIFVFKN